VSMGERWKIERGFLWSRYCPVISHCCYFQVVCYGNVANGVTTEEVALTGTTRQKNKNNNEYD